jgi:uncharacterized protein (TIGR00369 family)
MDVDPELADRFASVPVNRLLGLRLLSRSAEEVILEMDPRPDLLQETENVHGGILSTLADTASVYVFFPDLKRQWTMTSIELKMNFLRPVRRGKGPVRARARLVKRGRTVGVTEVEIHQDDALSAKGLFTYLFLDHDPVVDGD